MAGQAGSPVPASLLAQQTQVPRRYLTRVLQDLSAAGLVQSRPGPGGGYQLAGPTDKLTILDVVNAVSPIERIKKCPLGLKSHKALCPLHAKLDLAYEATERAFANVTLADLVDSANLVLPLCQKK